MKVTDLKVNEAIHCPTQEQFDYILQLMPNNKVQSMDWNIHGDKTCYIPSSNNGYGSTLDIHSIKHLGLLIYEAYQFTGNVIGYKLVKEQYEKAAVELCYPYNINGLAKGWEVNTISYGYYFAHTSIIADVLKEAGVLDLWFEPVYAAELKKEEEVSVHVEQPVIAANDEIEYLKKQNEHLKSECRRVKMERNEYEQKLIKKEKEYTSFKVKVNQYSKAESQLKDIKEQINDMWNKLSKS